MINGAALVSAQQSALPEGIDLPSSRIEDDSALRLALMDSWLTEVPARVAQKPAEYHTLKSGARVEVRYESSGDEFGVALAREWKNPRVRGGAFPGWAQGSWILSRRKADGEATRIRVFLRSDPYMYVQFRPFSRDKCQMDVVLYEAYLVRSLPLAVPFERLLALPLESILRLADGRFPRKYFEIEPAMYRDSRAFVAGVRQRLPGLSFVDDGAIDESGGYVFINTLEIQNPGEPEKGGLNCSGFAKWVVDGILKPLTGERLAVAPLKEPFNDRGSSFTETWETIRDPFFGLDWIRNLAARAGAALRSPAFAAIEEFEVRSWPFSQVIVRENGGSVTRPYPGFLPNAGFGIEGLHPLLYTLAVNEPGRVYLAAVNTEIGAPVTPENPRGLPRLRQYFHIAVLVPYFDRDGAFQVTVFESAAETSFSSFKNRYPGHFVNIARIPLVSGNFNPD